MLTAVCTFVFIIVFLAIWARVLQWMRRREIERRDFDLGGDP